MTEITIPYNIPACVGTEEKYLTEVIHNKKFSGDGKYTKKCQFWFEERLKCQKALMTSSCTHSLEMAAILIDILPGDEVIMPSFTFVSTALAFVQRGAKIVFVDIREDTLNIDENLIELAITKKTKAIVVVHYAGVGCEMDTILKIANKYKLFVIEDAAQGMMAFYKDRPLGTIGNIGAYSFHETKNFNCGEGGLTIVNDNLFAERAEIIREKGTNRSKFFRGEIDKYTWVDIGSSYLSSEFQSAFLYAQLEAAEEISNNRLQAWNKYFQLLKPLEDSGFIQLPQVPHECKGNGHIFYIKTENLEMRTKLIDHCKSNGILVVFHYIPLHSTEIGKKLGYFAGNDINTTKESERLIRLPLFYNITDFQINKVVNSISQFFQ